MPLYQVRIITKFGSSKDKEIEAVTPEAAIERAKAIFPLHREIHIVDTTATPADEPQAADSLQSDEAAFQRNITEAKLKIRIKAAKSMQRQGFMFIAAGILVALAILAITGYLFLWSGLFVAWGIRGVVSGGGNLQDALKELSDLKKAKPTEAISVPAGSS